MMMQNQNSLDSLSNLSASANDCYNTSLCHPPNKADETVNIMTAAVNRLQGQSMSMNSRSSIAQLQSNAINFCEDPYAGLNAEDKKQQMIYNRSSGSACRAFHSSLINADKNFGPMGSSMMSNPFSGMAR
jgi:hypothetical protein